MKRIYKQSVVLLVAVFSYHVSFGSQSSSAEQSSVADLEKKLSHLEALAKAGRPWKSGADAGYFFVAAKMAKQIKDLRPDQNRGRLAAQMLPGLLAKEAQLNEVTDEDLEMDEKGDIGMCDLCAAEDLADCLIDDATSSDRDRQRNAHLLARYLGRVRKEKVPNFKSKEVHLNVSPPVNAPGEGMAAGMDPNDIKDPVARAAYKAAIRTNADNNIWNGRQSMLNEMDSSPTAGAIKTYIADTFHGRPNLRAALVECMSEAKLSEKEKKEIERKVSKSSEE